MRSNQERCALIEAKLNQALSPSHVVIRDDSHHHVGHAGAKDGRGHFHITIVSNAFEKLTAIARHRLVYAALGDLMKTDIHACQIDAKTESEASAD